MWQLGSAPRNLRCQLKTVYRVMSNETCNCMNTGKQLSNPFSTGGGGGLFEAHVQASFVALMLTGGFAQCLPCWPIKKIKLQGKYAGYDTDDLIVFVEKPDGEQTR